MSTLINNGTVIEEAVCRCCRSTKKCRILTAEYTWKGVKEIYSEMIMDCFGILLSRLDEDIKDTGVCISCVIRLRDAFAFVQQLRRSEELFLHSMFEAEDETTEPEHIEPTVMELKKSMYSLSEMSSIHDDIEEFAESDKDIKITTSKDDFSNLSPICYVASCEDVGDIKTEIEDTSPAFKEDNDQIEDGVDPLSFSDLYKPLISLRASKRPMEYNQAGKSSKSFKDQPGNENEETEDQDQNVESYSSSDFSDNTIDSPIHNASFDDSSSENFEVDLRNRVSPIYDGPSPRNISGDSDLTPSTVTPVISNITTLGDASNSSSNVKPYNEFDIKHCVEKINKTANADSSDDSDTVFSRKRPKRSKSVRSKNYCLYCENFVTNFARHILRIHTQEPDVQKIVSKHKKSLVRKQLITALRKKGNFIQNATKVVKPMRNLNLKSTDYLPCPNCLGFYSKRHLWKHAKTCGNRLGKNLQSEAQNVLVRHLKIDEDLKEFVFSRMRADKVALVAKSDFLICAFGSECLRTLRERHSSYYIRGRLRELAKLLIVMKKLDDSIGDLLSALKPTNYDIILKATKIICKYKDRYQMREAFVSSILSSLRKCCNVAIVLALKKQGPFSKMRTEPETDLKKILLHLNANLRKDICSNGATDTNIKVNKITIVKLAKEVKKLSNYLDKKSEEYAVKIKEDTNIVRAYTALLEIIYCKVILLNRRRHNEVLTITLSDYMESDSDIPNMDEEFHETLTLSEQVLFKNLKKVIIKDKSSQDIPVYFSKEVQESINLLLSIRNIFIVDSNHFLFGNPGNDCTINGFQTFCKHARLSRGKYPKSISCQSFKRHVATLFQVFSMSKSELEQLAALMGIIVPKNLSEEPNRVAKICKLINDGNAESYIGRSLDEIDTDLNDRLFERVLTNDQVIEYLGKPIEIADIKGPIPKEINLEQTETEGKRSLRPASSNQDPDILESPDQNDIMKRNTRTLVPWTADQKAVVTKYFKSHIRNRQPPKKYECDQLKDKHPELLNNKDWLKIKVFIQNIYRKK